MEFGLGAEDIRLRPLPVGRTQGAVRARMNAKLGKIRLPLQVDVGFGGLPFPVRERCTYPVLLDQPEPSVWTYRRETHVAEKFHAMVQHGHENTRMKDLWDVATLAAGFSFHGPTLRRAIQTTFGGRSTTLGDETPAVFEDSFFFDQQRERLWAGFLGNTLLYSDGPVVLSDVGDRLRRFLGPIHSSIVRDRPFERQWPPGGPWLPITDVGR